MSLIVVPYEPVHAMLIPHLMNEPLLRAHPEYRSWAEAKAYSDEAVTILIEGDNKVIACCGVDRLWENVGEAWLMLSVEGARFRKSISAMSRPIFDKWFAYYRRIQATVDAASPVARRYVEQLGMELEGTLRRYGPFDKDYLMYARVK